MALSKKALCDVYRMDVMIWYGAMSGAAAAMPEERRAELDAWERQNLDGHSVATSDWPGWEPLIGTRPRPPEMAPIPKRRPLSVTRVLEVFRRDGFRCVACGSADDLTVDHILAVRRGGTNDMSNLQTLCRPCNLRKGAR